MIYIQLNIKYLRVASFVGAGAAIGGAVGFGLAFGVTFAVTLTTYIQNKQVLEIKRINQDEDR